VVTNGLKKGGLMKKLIAITILIIILKWYDSAYANPSVALKIGQIRYNEQADSIYQGNTVYDNAFCYGGFLRFTRDNWILRFDYDTNKTGNTFKNFFPNPYEKIDLEQTRYIVSAGSYFLEYLYFLVGAGYNQNDGYIEQYPTDPYSYTFNNNVCYSATVGLEKSFNHWFMFMEYRYLWSEMDVEVNDRSVLIDDVSNQNIYVGVGYAW